MVHPGKVTITCTSSMWFNINVRDSITLVEDINSNNKVISKYRSEMVFQGCFQAVNVTFPLNTV